VYAVLDELGRPTCSGRHDRRFERHRFEHRVRRAFIGRRLDEQIHRLDDPAELLIDPKIRFPKLAVASRLARKALGMRYLMDVIGLDATVVRGSHGRPTDREQDGPLFITTAPELLGEGPVPAASVKQLLLDHLFPVAI